MRTSDELVQVGIHELEDQCQPTRGLVIQHCHTIDSTGHTTETGDIEAGASGLGGEYRGGWEGVGGKQVCAMEH
jgi:hypothetical protein